MILYIETSALAKLLVDEPESDLMVALLDGATADGVALSTSRLTETELRRLAVRTGLAQLAVTAVLDRLDVVALEEVDFTQAGLLPDADLRSLDALHLAVAMRIRADAMLTYDRRQGRAAELVGLPVVAPR